ncbi:hypothetical protein Tco_0023385, partial [Tanacetum coccineum]
DEGFEMTTPLNYDEVGMKNLLLNVSDLENDIVNDAAKILDGISASKNDVSKYVEYTERVTDGMNKVINEGMNEADDIAISKKRNVASRGHGISIRENEGQIVVLTDSQSDSSNHAYQNSKSDSDQSDKSFDYLSDVPLATGDEGTSTQGQHTYVDVDRFGEIDDTGVGLTPLIREHEKYMKSLLRKLKGNGLGITYPFAIVEESKEKYPIYDDLTHWKLKKFKDGFSLFFERSNKEKIVAKCSQRK